MRWIFLSTLLLSAVLYTLVMLSKELGTVVNPLPSALRGLDNCQLPCWMDITPYRTSVESANVTLAAMGYTVAEEYRRYSFVKYAPSNAETDCIVSLGYARTRISTIALSDCKDVRLGDVLLILGIPEGISASATALSFRNDTVNVTIRENTCERWFSPFSQIRSIYMDIPRRRTEITGLRPADRLTWRGFIPRTHYKRYELGIPRC